MKLKMLKNTIRICVALVPLMMTAFVVFNISTVLGKSHPTNQSAYFSVPTNIQWATQLLNALELEEEEEEEEEDYHNTCHLRNCIHPTYKNSELPLDFCSFFNEKNFQQYFSDSSPPSSFV